MLHSHWTCTLCPTDVAEDDWRVMLETSHTVHDEKWSIMSSPDTPFSPVLSRWRLPFSHSHVYSCKKTVPSESCCQKFLLLSLIMWAALIDSPVGILLHNIQLISPPTISWKWLGRFLFHFVPSPLHPTDHIQEKYLVCQPVPAAHSLASWGLQLENPAAGVCRIPRLIMFVKGQPWQHAPGHRHSSGLPAPLSFFVWLSFLFIYALTIQGSAKLQDLLDNLLLSKEMESVTMCWQAVGSSLWTS